MSESLEEARWKVKYGKPHHADWAKSLDGRIRTGGMWKTEKQRDHFFRLATVQPGSMKDSVTRALHKQARRKLPGVKASSRLLITRYEVSPGNGEWFGKVNIYEFDKDGLIRKWRVSRPKDHGGQGSEDPVFRWNTAEVLWKRTGYRATKEDHRVLPKSNVSGSQAESVAKFIARRYKINTMSDKALRQTVMRGILDRINPLVTDFKQALLYKLGKVSRAPQNMKDWEEVIATDVQKVIASFATAVKKKPVEIPNFGRKMSDKEKEDAHFDAQYREYAANSLGHEAPGVVSDLVNKAGHNPYESKDPVSADLRLSGSTVSAIGVIKESGERVFWLEQTGGEVYRYSKTKGEFGVFRNHLVEQLGRDRANRALVALRDKSKDVARGKRS